MATSLIYMQQSDICNHKKIKTFRDKLSIVIGDKHQSTLTKMGATISTGILDMGGRNCSLRMGSQNGFTKISSVAGIVLWLQHWHWYPMMHMISMALTPTFTIGLNKDFKYPKSFEIQCNSKPSTFAYPKRLEEKKEKEKKRVETVTLSTTAKNKARLARKRAHKDAEEGQNAMDLDQPTDSKISSDITTDDKDKTIVEEVKDEEEEEDLMEVDEKNDSAASSPSDEKQKKKKKEPEPTYFRITNPSRITDNQTEFCHFDLQQRYIPVRPQGNSSGVVMLRDTTPDKEEDDVLAVKTPSLDAEDEAEIPEPFEWAPPGHPEHVAAAIPTVPTE